MKTHKTNVANTSHFLHEPIYPLKMDKKTLKSLKFKIICKAVYTIRQITSRIKAPPIILGYVENIG